MWQDCLASGNEAVCIDRNECITQVHDCTVYQNCYNTYPGWMCFNDPQAVCRGNLCDRQATCVANPAMNKGYDCVCNNGYHGNGNKQTRFEDSIAFGVNGPKVRSFFKTRISKLYTLSKTIYNIFLIRQ